MKKTVVAVVGAAIAVFALSGCTNTTNENGGFSQFRETTVVLEDGRTVTCLFDYANGGIDCDWEGSHA